MALPLELEQLGLTEQDLDDIERDALKQKEEEKRAHRSVHFGDQVLDPLNVDYTVLATDIKMNFHRAQP